MKTVKSSETGDPEKEQLKAQLAKLEEELKMNQLQVQSLNMVKESLAIEVQKKTEQSKIQDQLVQSYQSEIESIKNSKEMSTLRDKMEAQSKEMEALQA